MKKFLIILLSLVLIVACAGCGTRIPAIVPENPGNSSSGNQGSGSGNQGSDTDDPSNVNPPPGGEEEVFTFTVTLYETNGKGDDTRFYPQVGQDIEVMWSGESAIATAKVDPTGVASKKGLDGDFRVSISKLPLDSNGNPTHTYNPNGITADNNNRDIKIVLIPIRSVGKGNGTSNSTKYNITTEGAYLVTFRRDKQEIWYQYKPTVSGIYTIETLIDAEANEVNPTIKFYNSNTGGWYDPNPWEVITDGGAGSSFTKNAKWQVMLDSSEIGNIKTFTLSIDSKVDYPVNIYFSVTYVGEFYSYFPVQARGPFYTGPAPVGNFRFSYMDNRNGNRYYTDGSLGAAGNPMRFKLQWNDLDGNGKYTPVEWVDTNGNGVFDKGEQWKDTNGNGVVDIGDEWIDTNGNGVLDWTDKNGNGKYDPGEGEMWKDTNGNGKFDEGDEWVDDNKNGVFDWNDKNKNGIIDVDEVDEWWDKDGDGECGLDTGDGFYHFYDEKLYAETGGWGDLLWGNLLVQDDILVLYGYMAGVNAFSEKTKTSYFDFLNAYRPYCFAGRHPVNKEIMEMFQDLLFSLGYYNDGTGAAESGFYMGVQEYFGPYIDSAHDSMFLLFSGYFI